MLYNCIGITLQETHDLLDLGVILLQRDLSDAASTAAPDMEIQTRAELFADNRVRSNLVVARTDFLGLRKDLKLISGVNH